MFARFKPLVALSALIFAFSAQASDLSAVADNLGVAEKTLELNVVPFSEVSTWARPTSDTGAYAARYQALKDAVDEGGGTLVRFTYHGGPIVEGYALVRDDVVVVRLITIH